MSSRVRDTRRRIPARRLAQYLLLAQIRNLLQNQVLVCHVCHDKHVLDRNDRTKTIHGHLQQTATRTEEVQKLLRLICSAVRPESTSDAARHNHAIVVAVVVLVLVLVLVLHIICFVFFDGTYLIVSGALRGNHVSYPSL